jgi:hypothetical protein
MQDPNEDTEWNDILRKKGIIPPKEKTVDEADVAAMMEATIRERAKFNPDGERLGKELSEMNVDELDAIEDDLNEADERELERYRQKRLQEMRAEAQKRTQFGGVLEISRSDWTKEVNEAPEGQYVLVHVYRQGLPLCRLMDECIAEVNDKFPGRLKCLRSEVSVCMSERNFPDDKLPLLLLYLNGQVKRQWMGADSFGGSACTAQVLEWKLAECEVLTTELESDPLRDNRRGANPKSIFGVKSRKNQGSDTSSDDDNDW